MKSVPNDVLTPKDCDYIADILTMLHANIKKIQGEVDCVEDKDVKKYFMQTKEALVQQYNAMLNLLK